MGQAGYPPDLIHRRKITITVSRTVIIPRTEPTDEGCSAYFVKCSASSIASRAAKPGTLTLFTSKGPFHFELDDLCMAIDADSDLGPTETPDTQHRMIFQELMIRPFPLPSGSEGCDVDARAHRPRWRCHHAAPDRCQHGLDALADDKGGRG